MCYILYLRTLHNGTEQEHNYFNLKNNKIEPIDIFAILYILFTLFLFKSNTVHKSQLLINLFMILMYFKIRFIK